MHNTPHKQGMVSLSKDQPTEEQNFQESVI